MHSSIQQFCEEGIPELMRVQEELLNDPKKMYEFIKGGVRPFIDAALAYYGETFTGIDDTIRESLWRKEEWYIVRRDDASLLCSIGRIHYSKTLFINRTTGERRYLVDDALGLGSHARMTEDAVVEILREASESSYRKGGEKASLMEPVSKQTVLNELHGLTFPKEQKRRGRKSVAQYLYIDADEDHVALQYDSEHGDLKKSGPKSAMPRLIYIYEGVEEYNGSTRHHLVNVHHFGGLYDGNNDALWKEVDTYIRNNYDEDALKKVYIHGDGANWIRNGKIYIPKSVFVLDRFHMHKYIIAATSHLLDSADDVRSELYRAIHKRNKGMAADTFEKILAVTDNETKYKAVQRSKDFILNNWAGIMESLKNKENQTGCSAEGHVSHIYSDRLSSRPLGWSRTGVDKMARLRIYRNNSGTLIDLVRFQKRQGILPQAVGEEKKILLSHQVIRSERSKWGDIGKYYDSMQCSFISPESRKGAAIIYYKCF